MIRIIYDDNGNQQWDTGNFLQDRYPEEVYYVKTIIEAKANWEVEERVLLNPWNLRENLENQLFEKGDLYFILLREKLVSLLFRIILIKETHEF